jgi:hypothetical protein
MRANGAECPTTHRLIRPPVPRTIGDTAIVRPKHVIAVTNRTDRARFQHAAHNASAVQKAQLVIDQGEYAGGLSLFSHSCGLGSI